MAAGMRGYKGRALKTSGCDGVQEGASPLPALEGDKAELTRLMDEYQKLDAEDYVGGMPTRFRYQQVRFSFGMRSHNNRMDFKGQACLSVVHLPMRAWAAFSSTRAPRLYEAMRYGMHPRCQVP